MKKLIELVKHFEGCRLFAYRDPVGIPTIGYGHVQGVKMGMKITQEQADQMLEDALYEYYDKVCDMTPGLVECERLALTSFAYNCGLGALKRSTLLKKALDYAPDEAIKKEFMKWTKAGGKELPGLVRRRKAEAHLFITGKLEFFQ